ncbi:MAG: transporter substrate-binding domain-containing protein [Rhizobiaceae bacterium]
MKFAHLIEPPFNHRTATGELVGCDVELARYIASKLGGIVFQPIETEFAELLPGVANGQWRMTTGLFDTQERRKIAAFSRPIWALNDGLLVANGNPFGITGYKSAAANERCIIAIVRDQVQHYSAVEFGTPESRLTIFGSYQEAANAVRNGKANAFASVAMAHLGFLRQNPDFGCEIVTVPSSEKLASFGAFAFALDDTEFQGAVDEILNDFIGTDAHRKMMRSYGFSDADVDLIL